MTARREFLAGLAGVTAAAGATVAAVASPRPDAALFVLVNDLRHATAEVERTTNEWFDAGERAEADCPPELPDWDAWKVANHPRGAFDPAGPDGWRQRAVEAEMDAPGFAEMREDEQLGVLLRHVRANVADRRAFEAEARPAYDALQAERAATVKVLDEREGVPALLAANLAAEARERAALAALLACRPQTAAGLVAKVAAILGRSGDPGEAVRGGEAVALLADARALIGGPA